METLHFTRGKVILYEHREGNRAIVVYALQLKHLIQNTFTYTNIFTHTNMYVPENRQKIERVLRDYFVDGTDPTERPHGVELVLEIPQSELEDGKPDFICGYYYADWEKRVVLWHDGMDIAKITKGQRPLASMSHLGAYFPWANFFGFYSRNK